MDNDIQKERKNLEDLVQYAVEKAREMGATESKVRISKATGLSVSCRNAEMENVSFTNGRSMYIGVFKDDRKGGVSTSDLSHEAIDQSIMAALSIARYTDLDVDSRLPDKDLLVTEEIDFNTFHPREVEPEELFVSCRDLEAKAVKANPLISTVISARESASTNISAMANSLGFVKSEATTTYVRNLTLLCEKDGDKQYGSSYTYDSNYDALFDDDFLLDEAINEGVNKLCPRKLATGDYPLILDVEQSSMLLNVLFAALDGHVQYYKTGFLSDSLGQLVMPSWLSIDENPHVYGKLSSCYMDADGVKTRPMSIIKNGVVQEYFLNNYFSNKLKMKNNAHNRGVSNTFVTDSRGQIKSREELIRQMDRGIIVDDIMGNGIKLISGEVSVGASGFYVENGQIQYPIAEFTIAGNFKDMFNGIVALANDGDPRNVADLGSVLIDNIKVAGV